MARAGQAGRGHHLLPLILVLPLPLFLTGEHQQSILLRPKRQAARERRLLSFKMESDGACMDQDNSGHVGVAGAAEPRPTAHSVFKDITQRASSISDSASFRFDHFRKLCKSKAFCEQALEEEVRQGRQVFFVRPGFEALFRSQVQAYAAGEGIEW